MHTWSPPRRDIGPALVGSCLRTRGLHQDRIGPNSRKACCSPHRRDLGAEPMARVVAVSVAPIVTPLHTPFVTALRRAVALNSVVVRLTDDEGQTGFGEAP